MTLREQIVRGKEDLDRVYEAGQQAEYDRFWDKFLQNGTRTDYRYTEAGVFHGAVWGFENFFPKYDITPVGDASYLFYQWKESGDGDLAKRFRDCGSSLDTSGTTKLSQAFYQSHIKTIPTIDATSITDSVNGIFEYWEVGESIEKIIVTETTPVTRWFVRCWELQNLEIEGTIGESGLNISWSTKLSHDSLMSIINALKDYSSTTSTWTATLGTENLAKLTDAEKAIATQKGWTLA